MRIIAQTPSSSSPGRSVDPVSLFESESNAVEETRHLGRQQNLSVTFGGDYLGIHRHLEVLLHNSQKDTKLRICQVIQQ